jgi:predicted nucleic acid-binding protein
VTVVLDTGPLGLITQRRGVPVADACKQWLDGLLARDVRIVLPEIADYELRRELVRAGKSASVIRLDRYVQALHYEPITTNAMRKAAELWAFARQQGLPTAADAALDGDVILSAQSLLLPWGQIVVATTNIGHLRRFITAERWTDIKA